MKKKKAGRKPHAVKERKRIPVKVSPKQLAYLNDLVACETYGRDRPSVLLFLLNAEINRLTQLGLMQQRSQLSSEVTEEGKDTLGASTI